MTETEKLVKAALAVCDRWDTPDWSDHRHTRDFINDLRAAANAWNARPDTEKLKEAITVLTRMRENRAGTNNAAIATERRALDTVIEALTAWNTRPDEGELEPDWAVSKDGPIKIGDQRRWLARKLMDSKLTDKEAFGIVCYHPNISDLWKARTHPAPALDREGVKTALQSSRGWPADLHPGPAADAILAMVGGGVPAGWQDIATASKKHGQIVLLYDGKRVFPGYWGTSTYDRKRKAYNEGWVTGPSSPEDAPTHWMPLPDAPASTVEG